MAKCVAGWRVGVIAGCQTTLASAHPRATHLRHTTRRAVRTKLTVDSAASGSSRTLTPLPTGCGATRGRVTTTGTASPSSGAADGFHGLALDGSLTRRLFTWAVAFLLADSLALASCLACAAACLSSIAALPDPLRQVQFLLQLVSPAVPGATSTNGRCGLDRTSGVPTTFRAHTPLVHTVIEEPVRPSQAAPGACAALVCSVAVPATDVGAAAGAAGWCRRGRFVSLQLLLKLHGNHVVFETCLTEGFCAVVGKSQLPRPV